MLLAMEEFDRAYVGDGSLHESSCSIAGWSTWNTLEVHTAAMECLQKLSFPHESASVHDESIIYLRLYVCKSNMV